MFPVNKEILMMLSLAFALFAIFYLYKDTQKTKLEVQKLSEASQQAVVVPKAPAQKKPAPPTPSPDADESN
jgi:hypothetical protein